MVRVCPSKVSRTDRADAVSGWRMGGTWAPSTIRPVGLLRDRKAAAAMGAERAGPGPRGLGVGRAYATLERLLSS
ncbi:hypothetical protein GA0115243_102316 [Streptomyces sp. ScaeMP-e83]|nr:hypothetical protein GA0115243_102316 [Streptomyces sp. ScaeMP-e83]